MLTEVAARQAKPAAKPRTLFESRLQGRTR